MADRPTIEVYDREARRWVADRRADNLDLVRWVDDEASPGPIADLGCGPGWHLTGVDRASIAVDASASMLAVVPEHAPAAFRVRASLTELPLRTAGLGGAIGSKSYVHLRSEDVPTALAELHRALAPGSPVFLHLFGADEQRDGRDSGPFGGRHFSIWAFDRLSDVLHGAGFEVVVAGRVGGNTDRTDNLLIQLRRGDTLADSVGPGMRLLVCGLNPSLHSARSGVGYSGRGNRFWAAATGAGLIDASSERRPGPALRRHRLGMTDLVKRATRRADELVSEEYRSGLDRVARLVHWLSPGAVCFVGLAGWRVAVDRRAVAGLQGSPLGGRPVYLMPSTSGLNAATSLDTLIDHFRAAVELADGGRGGTDGRPGLGADGPGISRPPSGG